MSPKADQVYRSIQIDFGQWYVYVTYRDQGGNLISEERWEQPIKLSRAEAADEARELYDVVYQHCQDTVLHTASPDGEGDTVDEEED